jgi:cytochrome c oxidase subunit 2
VRVRIGGLALTGAAWAVTIGGCGGEQSTLDPASPAAHAITTLWWWMLAIAGVVFAGAVGMLGLSWVRRRRRGLPLIGRDAGRNLALVVIFGIVIPAAVNVGLFIVANFVVMRDTDAPAATRTSMRIEVVGRQWWWEVRYPGTAAVTANEIHIPVRTRVTVVAVTGDVIHSFWVPRLNRKIDMIPGRRNRVELYADRPGRYRGQCAEFCGAQHSHMAMYVFAQEPAEFTAWLRKQAAPARRGERAFFDNGCASCHTIRGTEARGDVGPDLTHVGGRSTLAALTLPNTPGALADWLRDPQHVKPGNRMPDLDLGDAEIRTLARYLRGLK